MFETIWSRLRQLFCRHEFTQSRRRPGWMTCKRCHYRTARSR